MSMNGTREHRAALPRGHGSADDPPRLQVLPAPLSVTVPLTLTPEMIQAVRDDPLTKTDDREEWFARLGWLVCAWDVLLEAARREARGG